jgi:undecaprenyl diphosphate synthase
MKHHNINHLAIIMDGNSRWAKQKNLPYYFGHRRGAAKAKLAIELAIDYNIKHLSLFAFSAENWQRPEAEVSYLMNLFERYLTKEINNLRKHGIKLYVIGDLSFLKDSLRQKIHDIMAAPPITTVRMHLYVALSYGAKDEIVNAVQKIIDAKIATNQVTLDTFKNFLYAPDMPDVDMVIRTGGNWRISNFLLWHIAYSELYFIDKFWPDFNKQEFDLAISSYQQTTRTFGAR